MLAPGNFVHKAHWRCIDLMYAILARPRLLLHPSRVRLHSTAATTNRTVYIQDTRLS